MFNLSHPEVQNKTWAIDPTLFKEDLGDGRFNAQDWDQVPKVRYSTALFRRMQPPKMARVISDPSEFELETYGAPIPESELLRKKALLQQSAQSLAQSRAPKGQDRGASNAASPAPKRSPKGDPNALSEESLESTLPDSAMARAIAEFMSKPQAEAEDEDSPKPGEGSRPAEMKESRDQNLDFEGELEDPPHSQNPEASSEDLHQALDTSSEEEDRGEGQSSPDPAHLLLSEPNSGADASSQSSSELDCNLEDLTPQSRAADLQKISELEAELEVCRAKEHEWLQEKSTLQASVEGLDHAVSSLRAEHEQELQIVKAQSETKLQEQLQLLSEVTSKIDEFTQNSQLFYEPMKRLALHIAEQLVLAELNLSGSSIERLIQRCLDELPSHGVGVVTVELNPQDKARLEEGAGDVIQHIQLRSLASLKPGSVRVISDDTQVDDFVTHRLEAMAHSLLGQPEAWKERSPFFRQPLAQRDTEIEDVSQRHDVLMDSRLENEND